MTIAVNTITATISIDIYDTTNSEASAGFVAKTAAIVSLGIVLNVMLYNNNKNTSTRNKILKEAMRTIL